MRVLFVEDSELLRRSVSDGLRNSGYAVDTAADGEEGLHLARTEPYDVIVLDISLPKLNGFDLLKKLRKGHCDVPVLLLTARNAVADRVIGLRAGADDYLVKPFAFEELLARIEALVRRRYHVKQPRIRVGPIWIDTVAKTITRDGVHLDVTRREYALLEYLAMRQGEVVTRTEIEAHIYDSTTELMSNVVDSVVYTLRRKIDPGDGTPSLIQTRVRMGYVLDVSNGFEDQSADA